MAEKKKKEGENQEEEIELCKKCGSKLVEEDGELICPRCSYEIDFFGDEEEEF